MAVVVVVFEVARDTRHIHFIVERVLAVAVAAAQLRMLAVERKVRVTRMIELRVVPAGRRVAVAAFLSAAPVVRVVFGMAVEARGRRADKRLVFMATGTLGFRVLADQREAGGFVIEFDVGPGNGGMAVGALGAHRVAVNVVGLVAGKAV